MRVAFVVNNYPPKTGGVETHVHSLAHRLQELGHKIVVITLAREPGRAVEDGVEVIRLREYLRLGDVLGFPAPGTTHHVARLLEARSIDVVSVHTRFFPLTWVGFRAARRTGAVVVHTEHGSDHVVSSSRLITVASRIVDRTFGRSVLRRADVVLGVSENVVAFVQRLSGRKAQVFYNAIDRSAGETHDRAPAAIDRLVFVGRLVEGKGADVFVDVIAATGMEGVVLGDGPARAELEQRVDDAQLRDRIRLCGRVPVDEVRTQLRGAILVNPTTLAEGFQTTLLEALDVGGRIATFDVPGARLLRDQGYPVEIAASTSAGLVDAVQALRERGRTAPELHGWYWEDRAAEYVDVLTVSIRQRSANTRR